MRMPYTILISSGSLANTASGPINVTTPNNQRFVLREMRTTGTLGVTFQITVGNNLWQSSPIDSSVIGHSYPVKYAMDAIVIDKNTKITGTIYNNSGGAITDEEILLIGFLEDA